MKKLLTLLTLIVAAWTASSAQLANDPVINDDDHPETYRLACVADTWVRNVTSAANDKNGKKTNSAEITEGSFYGLFGFERIDIPADKKIKFANLHIMSDQVQGAPIAVVNPYIDFDEENVTYNTEKDNIDKYINLDPTVRSSIKGNGNGIGAEKNTLDNFTNNIDVTSIINYLLQLDSQNFNFIIRAEGGQKTTLVTKDNTIQITLSDGTEITSEQLVPYLEITLEDEGEHLNGILTLLPDADTYHREDNKNHGGEGSMEIDGDTFVGLMRFLVPADLLDTDNYELTQAELRLVTTQNKGDRKFNIYDFPKYFAEDTKGEKDAVTESLQTEPIATFEAKGMGTKSLSDDFGNNWEQYNTAEAWTNYIDLSTYVKDKISNGATSFNILIQRPTPNPNNKMKIATKEVTSTTNEKTTVNGELVKPFTFKAEDLVPQLTITYVKKPTVKISKNDKDLDASITVSGTHKVDNRITITVDNEGFDYSQVKVDVAPRAEAKNIAPRKAAEAGTSEYHTATADENGINVTFLKAGKYTMTIAPADETALQFKAISQDVDIETLKVMVGTPMTTEWTQEFAYGGKGYALQSLIEYPGSAEIEDLDVTLALTPSTSVDFNTATQPAEWSLSTGMNQEMWNLMVEMQKIGKVDAYYSEPTDGENAVRLDWDTNGSTVSGDVTAWFPCSGVYTLTLSSSDEGVEFVDSNGNSLTSVDYTIQPDAKLSYTYTDNNEEQQKETLSLSGYIVGEDGTMVIDKKLTKDELSKMVLYLPGCYLVEVGYTLDFTQSTEQDGTENLSRNEIKRKVDGSGKNGLTLDLSSLDNSNTTDATLSLTLKKNGATAKPYTFSISLGENPNVSTGIEGIEAEADGEVEYFNLQGVKVKNPDHGIYIRVAGGKASKVIL